LIDLVAGSSFLFGASKDFDHLQDLIHWVLLVVLLVVSHSVAQGQYLTQALPAFVSRWEQTSAMPQCQVQHIAVIVVRPLLDLMKVAGVGEGQIEVLPCHEGPQKWLKVSMKMHCLTSDRKSRTSHGSTLHVHCNDKRSLVELVHTSDFE
jgi:hypothetical protein